MMKFTLCLIQSRVHEAAFEHTVRAQYNTRRAQSGLSVKEEDPESWSDTND